MLKRITTIAPKGRYVAGRGVSGAGLTASVVRDEFLNGWSLEAGALVLASNGLCAIDEMDKMIPEDRSAMHEALEQQTVSISKANIQATLIARTTVLAAANPKFGRFDPYETVASQINLPSTLINRFDLIFPIKDLPDEKKDEKFPELAGNCIGGGLHSEFVRRKRPDFQEFLLIPKEKSFCHAVTINLKAYYKAKSILKSRRINDENAVETFKTNEEVLEVLSKIAKQYKLRIGLDIAASSFFEKGYYKYKNKELIRDKVDQTDYIKNLIKKFNIFYVEDPMQEEDFSGFKEILNYTKDNNLKTLVVGDDLVTTNMRLTMRAVGSDSINAMIIKPNQIGSLIEVKKVVEFCNKHNIIKIFSHRSGETSDNILADYCIGFEGDFIKTGIYGRERLIKLKRIIDIEKTLNRF